MKKTVRIRKALPGETPGYITNASKFLKKASNGMQMSSSVMDPARLNKIYDYTYSTIKNSGLPDLVYNKLITEYALDQTTSLNIIQAAITKLTEEGYLNPDLLDKVNPEVSEDGQPVDQSEDPNEVAERESSDAEQEELALSNEGYEGDDSYRDDNSHLETEQSQQQGAFSAKYGGFYSNGGEQQKPFSIQDLMTVTPGMEGTDSFSDLENYFGSYKTESEEDELPRADGGLEIIGKTAKGLTKFLKPESEFQRLLSSLNKAEALPGMESIMQKVSKVAPNFNMPIQQNIPVQPIIDDAYIPGEHKIKYGFDYINQNNPMQNISGARKAAPLASLVGEGISNIPWLGKKFGPKLETPFTQNRYELWNVLNGLEPTKGIFSKNSTIGGDRAAFDGSLSVDKLVLYQDDVNNIIKNIESGKSSFPLSDINPISMEEGLVSGVYPMTSKIISGVDENDNNFFEIKNKFGPNQQLPFGATPKKAQEITFKNRFYFTKDAATGETKIFDTGGNPLKLGTQTKWTVKPPFGTRGAQFLQESLLRDSNTSFPNYNRGEGVNVTGLPPTPRKDLSLRGQISRGLETYGTTGLNQFFRTNKSNIEAIDLPAFGYVNTLGGQGLVNPVDIPFAKTAADIKNAKNYKFRLGLKGSLLGTGLGYAGYQTYDAIANPCQCVDPGQPNYMEPDLNNNCPCGTDIGAMGPSRQLEDVVRSNEGEIDPKILKGPDSMQYIEPGFSDKKRNYYRHNQNLSTDIPSDDFKKGGITKKKFITKLSLMFDEGGQTEDNKIGQGVRQDTLTNDISDLKSTFIKKLKNNSNKAISKEVYENAKYNPEIMNLIMKDGPKENLVGEEEVVQNPVGAFGGFIDMNAENPLTKFMYGGDEDKYYQPYGLYEARNGVEVKNKSGRTSMISDKQAYQEWLDDQTNPDNWPGATAGNNPGDNLITDQTEKDAYDSWKTEYMKATNEANRVGDFEKYLDFYNSNVSNIQNRDDIDRKTVKECPAGFVYNDEYGDCVPLASIKYNTQITANNPGLWDTILPWNPILRSRGSYGKQTKNPYYINSGDPYTGQLPKDAVARYVTKTGMFGRPKKYLDIYDVSSFGSGAGASLNLESLKELENNLGRSRNRTSNTGIQPNGTKYVEGMKIGRNQMYQTKLDPNGIPMGIDRKGRLRSAETSIPVIENSNVGAPLPLSFFPPGDPRGAYLKSQLTLPEQPAIPQPMPEGYPINNVGPINTEMAYGGYLPQAANGEEIQFPFLASSSVSQDGNPINTPTSYTGFGSPGYDYLGESIKKTNSEFENQGGIGEGGIGPCNEDEVLDPNSPCYDPNYKADEKKYVGVENKVQNMKTFDPEAMLNVGNTGIRAGIGVLNNFERKNQQKELYDKNWGSTQVSGDTARINKGKWNPNSGNSYEGTTGNDTLGMGPMAKYGRYMANGGYAEPYNYYTDGYLPQQEQLNDDEAYMTEEQIQQYLAAGGQIEYI
jgi:hypothetical protein